jgi:hypothetical protein
MSMRSWTTAAIVIGGLLLLPAPASADVVSGVMTVTGAEMH